VLNTKLLLLEIYTYMAKNIHLKCPACNKNNLNDNFIISRKTFNSLSGYKYLRCKSCSTIYLCDKKITSEELTKLHSKYWTLKKQFQFKKKKIPNKQINEWQKNLKKLVKGKKNALDIGCGKGIISHALSNLGLNKIYAFDVNLSETYKKSKKVIFFNSDFENFEKRNEIINKKFDLIMLMGVLEHSFEPNKLIKKIKLFSSKKTKILVLVPNSNWLQIMHLKNYAWSMEAPFHRTLFSFKGLNQLFKKNNFEIKKIDNQIKMWGWTKRISEFNNNNSIYKKLREDKNFRRYDFIVDDFLETISIKMNLAPYIFVEAKLKK